MARKIEPDRKWREVSSCYAGVTITLPATPKQALTAKRSDYEQRKIMRDPTFWARVAQRATAALASASVAACLWLCAATGHAQIILNWWLFDDANWSFTSTNWLNDWHGHPPVSYTNLVKVPGGGDGTALLLDSTNAAWLQYRVVEADNSTNLALSAGSLLLWVSPTWSGTNQGGAGPEEWGRLV